MAASRAAKAQRRAESARAQVREDLGDGEYPEAVYTANAALLSELAKARRLRPDEAALIHAEVAATVLALGERIRTKKPLIPQGWEKGSTHPEDMLAVFDAVIARVNGGRHG